MTCRTKINCVCANPGDQYRETKFVLAFGAYGATKLLAYGHLESAIEACGDWIIDHALGLLVTDEVNEAYEQAIADGVSETHAWDDALVDTVSIDSGNHYLTAHEVHIVAENPSREELEEIFK